MSHRVQKQWLSDITEAVDAIRSAEALLADDADSDVTSVVIDAITYRVMTIGEAVKNIRPDVRDSEPQIPWSSIAALRAP